MSPARVVTENEVSINGVFYPLSPGKLVQPMLASIYPQKIVTGDYTQDSQQRASVLAWSDWRGGIGLKQMRTPEGVNRAWWSTCNLRHKGHLVLAPLATMTAASGVSGSFTVGALGELNSEVYGVFGTDVRKYNNTSDSWGASLATLPAPATDVITFRLGGTVYLAFATTGGYSYTSDGAVWTNDTAATLYFVFWDNAVWGIDNTGLLWKSTAIGVENSNAQLPLPNGSVTKLFLGRNAADTVIIFAATTQGLFAHDNANTKWLYTEFALPLHPDNGKGATRWRDASYIPAGQAAYRYLQGSNQAIVAVMGPDRDDGLPSEQRGVIRQLIGTHNDLLALTDATSAGAALNLFATQGLASHRGAVMNPNAGLSSILAWDEHAWQVLWAAGSSGTAITAALVSNAYSAYRLWFAHNQRVYYLPLNRDVINPSEITTYTYAASGDHQTPWFTAEQADVDKLALSLRVECAGMSATETVVVSYATNYATSWTQFGTISSNGITTYQFPNATTPNGTAFRAIRFRLQLARGATTTVTPDVLSLTFVYRKKLPTKWGWLVDLTIAKPHKDLTPAQLRANLLAAITSTTLVEFTFRDDDKNTRNYYVDLLTVQGLEQTGHNETGRILLTMAEP